MVDAAPAVRWVLFSTLAAATALSLLVRLPPFIETALWGALVLVSFVGWGAAVKRLLFRGASVDVGLLGAWGAGFVAVVGGVLGAASLLRRPVLIGLVVGGIVLAAGAIVRPDGPVRRTARALVRLARQHPLFALLGVITVATVAFHYAAAIADWHVNPYDDEIAYLASVKKLLDTGSFPEPYSLRRLSALGGQIIFVALVAPRAAMSQAHTFDHGICLVMIALLVAGYRGARSPSLLFRLATTVFLCIVPNTAINTASYFSGVLFFFALFRTLVFLERRRETRAWAIAVPLALLSATVCTLRQNYLPVPVIVLGVSFAFVVLRSKRPWLERLHAPALTALFTVAALVPYFVMSYASNKTFLFPIIMGDANAALQLKATDNTLAREATMAILTLMDGVPVRTLPILMILFWLVRERRIGRPTWALGAGALGGFLLTVHSFTQADVLSLGRYVFAGAMALSLALILEAGAQMPRNRRAMGRSTVAGVIALTLVVVEVLQLRPAAVKTYERHIENIEALARTPRFAPPATEAIYDRLQGASPRGEPIAVVVDEPLYLDYARNPIYNVDMPGFASPIVAGRALPFFQGSEKVADYFRAQQVKYVAFVRPDRSRYHYRRDYWIERLADDAELWRTSAPYVIDMEDTLTDLSRRYPIVFEEHGLVLVRLGESRDAS